LIPGGSHNTRLFVHHAQTFLCNLSIEIHPGSHQNSRQETLTCPSDSADARDNAKARLTGVTCHQSERTRTATSTSPSRAERHKMNDIRVTIIREYDRIYNTLSEEGQRQYDAYKREYRNSLRNTRKTCATFVRYSENGESVTRRYDYYNMECTLHEFMDIIAEFYYIPEPMSQYDCTGRLFTSGLSVYDVHNGHYVAYVTDCRDV
jgi:hypothetical protein